MVAPEADSSKLRALHVDEDLVVVDKPSGMVVHRGWARDPIVAVDVVAAQLGRRVYPVHRLDRGTSGCLLFALSPEVAAAVQAALQAGEVDKRYVLLCRGQPPDSGVVDHPVPRGESKADERVPAVTAFERLHTVAAELHRYSLMRASPRTGRLHQIRRHFKHLSHPLIGDVNYGKGRHNRWFREHVGLHRLALHAASLRFRHPRSGAPVEITAPLPPDLSGPLARLGIPEDVLEEATRG